jgi:NitT/TauT family transport system substrate-binding protein
MINRRVALLGGTLGLAALDGRLATAAPTKLRIAALRSGSLGWLLETIRAEGLDARADLELDIVDVATNQAGPVALLAGDVEMIVSDWTWALRQRASGEDFKFAPFSSALGAVMVPPGSPARSLADLAGKRLGVAGSAIDKSWLLLRAYTRKTIGKDAAELVVPVFAAAPLLTEEIRNGRLDAVLNFWPFAARLAAQGYQRLIDMTDVLKTLDIAPVPPMVGFVWRERLELAKRSVPAAFLAAVVAGNQVLAQSGAAWERVRHLVKPANEAEFAALKAYYRAGIPGRWSEVETWSAEKLTQLLIELGDKELMGPGTRFDAKLFHASNG